MTTFKPSDTEIEVVLATFQGARFLEKQLGSLADQHVPPKHVLAGDDGSTDATCEQLRRWTSAVPFPVTLLPGNGRPRGPAANFGRLLAASSAPWVATCDQDDCWHKNKLERLISALPAHDQIPTLLVHDMRLVDATGDMIAPSFWRHQRFAPRHGARFATLLVMNSFPGCAMLANRALVDLALPLPAQAVMHDWWLALIAASCGRIVVVQDALADYRQHGRNVLGAPVAGWWSRVLSRRWLDHQAQARAMRQCRDQAAALQARALPMDTAARATLDRFLCSLDGPGWRRPFALWRNGNVKTYWPRNLRFLVGSPQRF